MFNEKSSGSSWKRPININTAQTRDIRCTVSVTGVNRRLNNHYIRGITVVK
jgi:hypothetical protein